VYRPKTNVFAEHCVEWVALLPVWNPLSSDLGPETAYPDKFFIGFEVFTVVVLKSIFFWDMMPCSALSGTRRFGGMYRLHLQGHRIVQQSSEQASGKQSLPAEDRYI
jgi:hypothetical protein